MQRRTFLGGLAGATLLSQLQTRFADAATTAPPRLVVLYMPNCNQQNFWLPQGGFYPQTASGDAVKFTLNAGYTAFESVRQYMTLVEGLQLNIEGDAHSAAVVRFMTGGGHTGGNAGDPTGEWAKFASVDQVLLSKSTALQGTRVPSLQLIADDRQESANPVYVTLSWGLNTKPMTPSVFPHQVYDRLFAGAKTPQDPMAVARQLKREQSVLDFIKSDVGRLEARVPAARRPELQSHLQGIRELEGAVLSSLKAGDDRPSRPAEIDARVSANHAKAIDAHFAIMRSALSLDVTRVATFSYGSSNSFVDFAEIIGGAQFLENIDYPFAKFGVHALAHRDEGKKSAALLAITQWYAKKTVEFISSLATTPDSDGGTLLDNTLVVLFSECSEAHDHDGIPVALFGGKNLGLKGNRCLRYKDMTSNDLWTALAPAYKANLGVFGETEENQKPLPALLG